MRPFIQVNGMKIIASDYDGTLNHGGIDDEKRAAVAAWQKEGNLFVVVTGRDRCFCPEMKEKSGITMDYYLACNGALILDRQFETLDECRCEKAVILPLLQYLFTLDCPWGNVCADKQYRIYNAEHEDCPEGAATLTDAEPIPYFNQISTALPTFEESARVTAAIKERFGDVVNPLQNGTCIDIVPVGMDKAQGIYRLLALCGAGYDDVVAVGDNVNDIAMLKEFRSYAMENGVETVKQLAGRTTPSVTQLICRELNR